VALVHARCGERDSPFQWLEVASLPCGRVGGMEIPTLQTDRLLLRPFSAADVDAYAELNANQEVMRYIDKVQDREPPSARCAPTSATGTCAATVPGQWKTAPRAA